MRRFLAALTAAALGVASAAAAQTAEPAEPTYSVKVSLSPDDPDVHTATRSGNEYVEFYLFVDGGPTRGAEFGIDVDGGQFLGYILDDAEFGWVPLPIPHPYPGTVAQAVARSECADPPLCFGRMLVKPDRPGGRVTLEVTPSRRAGLAAILHCDMKTTSGFMAYPAALNGDPPPPHEVVATGVPAADTETAPTGTDEMETDTETDAPSEAPAPQ
jgi:hypothetical protein